MGHGDRSLLALPAASHHLRGKGDARYLGGYHRPGNAGRRGRRGADFRIDGRLGTPWHGPGVCHAHGRRRGGYARGLFPGRDAARQVRVSRLRRAVRARQYGVPRAGATREGLAMARQRRGEPRGDAGRRRGGRRPYSCALPRTTFDTILVAAAAREGAIVREGLTVESVVFDGNTAAGVFARSGNGKRETYRSRVVVGADGLRSVVARRLGLVRSSSPRRVAFTAHVADVAGMDGVGELHVSKRGYVGLGPVGDGGAMV